MHKLHHGGEVRFLGIIKCHILTISQIIEKKAFALAIGLKLSRREITHPF